MDAADGQAAGAAAPAAPLLRRLLVAGEPATPLQVAAQLEAAAARAARSAGPYVLLNMISSVDGRATMDGRSGPLSSPSDRALFHALRAEVDAVMVGAGTVRAERYGRMIRDPEGRRRRLEHGRSEEPLACVVSGRLELQPDLPLLATPQARVALITSSPASLPPVAADVEYVRCEEAGMLDLERALAELHERFAVRTLLCEGGPHLNSSLFVAGLVDELLLTLAPKLAGGDAGAVEALRILAGPALGRPAELELLGVLECESQLFLRYGVGA
jgi:riboflavin-specific deaminase-like protein